VTLDNTPLKLVLGNQFGSITTGMVYVILNGGAGAVGIGSGTDLFTHNGVQIANGGSYNAGGGFIFTVDYKDNATNNGAGNDVDLVATAVPEPGTWGMLVGGIGMLAFWQRRNRRYYARKNNFTTALMPAPMGIGWGHGMEQL